MWSTSGFSVLISFKQFGGRPIECIFPSKFSSSLQEVKFFQKKIQTTLSKTNFFNCSTQKMCVGSVLLISFNQTFMWPQLTSKSDIHPNVNFPIINGSHFFFYFKQLVSGEFLNIDQLIDYLVFPHFYGNV